MKVKTTVSDFMFEWCWISVCSLDFQDKEGNGVIMTITSEQLIKLTEQLQRHCKTLGEVKAGMEDNAIVEGASNESE